MPKLILNLRERPQNSYVKLDQEDGTPPVLLERIQKISVTADAQSNLPLTVEMTMYSPDFDSEVVISENTARAILIQERTRQLSFLSDLDFRMLKDLRVALYRSAEFRKDDPRVKALDKVLIAEKDRPDTEF